MGNHKIQNGISSLENLFAINTFWIPQYQRAYSWEPDPHLEAFLEDLRQQVGTQARSADKQYFLGTFLLQEEIAGPDKRIVNIVDGQQRMTTAVIFIATALALYADGRITFKSERPALLKRYFIYDDDSESQKLHTIAEDDPFFQSQILRFTAASCKEDSPSSMRLKSAADYFRKQVAEEEWEPLIGVLKNSKVMVYAVDNPQDATQIFELQNDRGKRLTNLEALKSFLMHCVYLYAANSADDRLRAIQTQFSKIYRSVEKLSEWNGTPDEDQLLANHCAAFLKWSDSGKEYSKPKDHVKATIKAMDGSAIISWIEEFVSLLVESYRSIEEIFEDRDRLLEFSELLAVRRMGSFWPLILKTWRFDKTAGKEHFRKTCRLLEVYAFRGYAVSNLRSDSGNSDFFRQSREFRGDFNGLWDYICGMCNWNNLRMRFVSGLDNPNFYNDEDRDAHYLLWRYENHLRKRQGQQHSLSSWRDFLEPRNDAVRFSVEHIAAQNSPIVDTVVTWNGDDQQKFSDVALHRLGNLVIDSKSSNSSKGDRDFAGKIKSLSENSVYLSQGELVRFVTNQSSPVWDVDAIHARHKHMMDFALREWDPQTWHQK